MARLEGTTRNDEVWWGWRCRNSMGGMMKYGGAGDVAVVFDVFWGGPIVLQRLARFNFTTSKPPTSILCTPLLQSDMRFEDS